MSYLTREELLMEVAPGAPIHSCIVEAVQECASEQVNVAFIHNERRYTVEWQSLLNQVKEGEL